MRHHVSCVHEQVQQTSTTGQREKTNNDHTCKLKARIERIPQNFTTLLDCATMLLAESGPTTSLAETVNHGLSQRRDTKHNLSQRRNTKHRAREKVGTKNITRHFSISTDSRAHGVFSTREQKVAAYAATSQRLAVTTKQPNAYD